MCMYGMYVVIHPPPALYPGPLMGGERAWPVHTVCACASLWIILRDTTVTAWLDGYE